MVTATLFAQQEGCGPKHKRAAEKHGRRSGGFSQQKFLIHPIDNPAHQWTFFLPGHEIKYGWDRAVSRGPKMPTEE